MLCLCLCCPGWVLVSGLLSSRLKTLEEASFFSPPLFSGSEFHIPLCLLDQVCPSALWVPLQLCSHFCAGNVLEAGGAAWRKTPLWLLLAWFGGSPVPSRAGRSVLIRVNVRRVDWKEKPSFLPKQQLCSCTPRRECLPWL